jgi:hypothetical protein
MFLDIHLEYCDDKGERLKKLAELGKPFSLSLVPVFMISGHYLFGEKNRVYREDQAYSSEITDFLKDIPKNFPHIMFGQQGLTHFCKPCYKSWRKRDPWHENKCLYSGSRNYREQTRLMEIGREIIEGVIKVSPELYVSPNHQHDFNTKLAAEYLEYRYFGVKGLLTASPYTDGKLMILPQRKVTQGGEMFYVHYDETAKRFERCIEIINNSRLLSEVEKRQKNILDSLNETAVPIFKRARDLGLR